MLLSPSPRPWWWSALVSGLATMSRRWYDIKEAPPVESDDLDSNPDGTKLPAWAGACRFTLLDQFPLVLYGDVTAYLRHKEDQGS